MNYPWHESQWQQFLNQYQNRTLPQAFLLYGSVGLGKKQFAIRLAQTLLCGQFSQSSCGQCQSCKLFTTGNHPDFLLVESDDKNIGVTQIRELILQLPFSKHSATYKLILINPASAMTTAACNALLKSLEEPPANTLLILITESLALLPATIVSRCQRMNFTVPHRQMLLDWLAAQSNTNYPSDDLSTLLVHYHNAPLRFLDALKNDEVKKINKLYADLSGLLTQQSNPIALARQWQYFSILTLLDWSLVWVYLEIRQENNNKLLCHRFFDLIDYLHATKQAYLQQVSLNQLLILESLFIKCKSLRSNT